VTLPYSAFRAQVRAGNVQSVTITGQDVQGAFIQPVAWPPAASRSPGPQPTAAANPTPGSSETSAIAADQSPTYTRFTTVLTPFPDDRLLPLLEQSGVTVTVKDTSGGSWLLDLAINVLPTLLFVGLIVLMARQAQRGQQLIMGFGGSKARRYNEERPDVTFADVAGEDEAKAELQEIVTFLKQPERCRALGARLPRGALLIEHHRPALDALAAESIAKETVDGQRLDVILAAGPSGTGWQPTPRSRRSLRRERHPELFTREVAMKKTLLVTWMART
jgi:cell division protease FtsH